MASVLISALIVIAISAAIGRAICVLSGWPPSYLAPAVGFAALLVIGGAVQFLPGDALTAAVLTALLAGGALLVRHREAPRSALVEGAVVVAVVLLLSSIPMLASGRSGILGAGNQNDMVQHLTTARWLDAREGAETILVRDGYPLGPHGVAAVVARGTGMSLVHAFNGVTLAIPVLTALAAMAALGGLPRPHRLVVAGMTALCYLAASYLVTGAFKETAEALFLLAFVLALRELTRRDFGTGWRHGVPLGVLAAGTIYTYSYLGAIWLIAAAGLFAVFELAGTQGGWRSRLDRIRTAAPAALGGLGALALLVAPQSGRMIEFSRSSFSHQAIEGTGNLLHAISPVQALGIWLRADFRFTMPPAVTVAVGVLAGTAALLALAWWLRRRDFALPAGVLSAAVVYWLATENKNVYNQAKGLAIAAPLVALMIGAALAAWSAGPRRQVSRADRTTAGRARLMAARAGALVLLCAAAASSFLALRDGPVSSDAHASDLAPVKNIVRDQPTLNMDQDDFSHWYLPGVDLGTGPLLYPTRTVPPRRGKPWHATQPFDFDSWSARNLNIFGYVVEPRTKFRSATPRGFELVRQTRWFDVWKRTSTVRGRSVMEHGGRPSRVLDCDTAQGRRLAHRAGVASVMPRPVVRGWRSWRGQPRRAGQAARVTVELPRGRWDVSLQYVSTMGLDVRGPGLRTSLPAHLGRIGPYWYVGTVRQRHDGRMHVRLTARQHGLFGRVLGARGFTRAIGVPGNLPLQGIAFTRHGGRNRPVPLREACGKHVDWYRLSESGRDG